MKKILILVFVVWAAGATTQQIFTVQYNDCNTGTFAMERDLALIHTDPGAMERIVALLLQADRRNKTIEGSFMAQILVDLEGNLCLLYVENKTNLANRWGFDTTKRAT